MQFTSENNSILIINYNIENSEKKQKEYLFLLNKKLSLEKEGLHYELEYIRLFGEKMKRLLELQTECIKFKKLIAIYYRNINNGILYNKNKILNELAFELKPYYDHLEYIEQAQNSKGKILSTHHIMKIKKLYKEIVNMIHPDISEDLFKNEKIKELWNDATNYYKCNNYEKLQETYFIIIDLLEQLNVDLSKRLNINNIDEKIEKIKRKIESIKNSDPYMLKYIISDGESIKEKNEEYDEYINSYNDYGNDLKNQITDLGININDYNLV